MNENRKKPIYGIGKNDADYAVQPTVNGKKVICPIYKSWFEMIRRCYSDKWHKRYPTYIDCTVCDEWLSFMKFREWALNQEWKGNDLDKDILIEGNKIYGPDTCVFVSRALNRFVLDNVLFRGDYPIGARQHKSGRFISRCSNPFNREFERLGMFDTPEEAHMAWKIRKHEHALTWSSKVDDPRLKQALQTRYKPY